jgi:hypothetical protein
MLHGPLADAECVMSRAAQILWLEVSAGAANVDHEFVIGGWRP